MNKIKKYFSKQTQNVLIIFLIFVAVSFSYFPSLLEGKVLDASDYNVFSGASKELKDFKAATGKEALWTNSIFGGMPAYLILTHYKGSILNPWFSLVGSVPKPVNFVLVNLCLFFLMGLIFGVNPWVSFAGSLAYGFSSYFFVVLGEGHVTKIQAITYFPLLIAGIYLAYNNKRFWGSILAAIGLSLILSVNHAQISYYAGIMAVVMVITYFISGYKEKRLPEFFKASGLLMAAVILAVGICFGPILTTYEYSKYSTRGKSELTSAKENDTSGLKREFILDYSYDFGEVLTAFIPRFKGGSNTERLSETSKTYKLMEFDQGKEQARKLIRNAPAYWGNQPIVRGPFYYGVALCFLFVLGLFIVKGKEKWWISAVVIVSLLLSLGRNLRFLSDFMIDYFPGYDKFRGVSNIIVIQQFAMALMALFTVREIYLRNIDSAKFLKSLKWTVGITGGLALLFVVIPSLAGSFRGISDGLLIEKGWPQQYIETLVQDRKSMLRTDAFRTLFFVILTAILIWAFRMKKLKAPYALILWVILIIADVWPVDKKYLNSESFVTKRRAETTFLPTEADKNILKDKDPSYRVLNLSLEPFTDTSTSYYHKSLGGNNGAKLRRYQDMIYFNISREIGVIVDRVEKIKTDEQLDTLLSGLKSINMLNTRYIIFNPDVAPITNPYALGNAWFVKSFRLVQNADEEVRSIQQLQVGSEVVVDRKFEKILAGKSFSGDARSFIKLTSYSPDKLVYEANCTTEQLAVFSEIYYPKGWISKIDGIVTPHFCADYILRSMVIPAGKHEIVFEFDPPSYKTGNAVSLASSVLLMMAIAGALFYNFRRRKTLNN